MTSLAAWLSIIAACSCAAMAKRKLLALSRSLRSNADDILELANEEESEGETSSPSPQPSPKASRSRASLEATTAMTPKRKRTRGMYNDVYHSFVHITLYVLNWPTELLKKAEKLSKALKKPPSASATEQCSSGRGSKDRRRGNKRGNEKDENITVWACS